MRALVRFCAVYNASVLAVFLTPGLLPALGVDAPGAFWRWLPALVALYAAIVLWLSSADLGRFGAFPYWNGIIRLVFVAAAVAMDFGGAVGGFIHLVVVGDLVLGVACIVGLPRATGRTHLQLLTNASA